MNKFLKRCKVFLDLSDDEITLLSNTSNNYFAKEILKKIFNHKNLNLVFLEKDQHEISNDEILKKIVDNLELLELCYHSKYDLNFFVKQMKDVNIIDFYKYVNKKFCCQNNVDDLVILKKLFPNIDIGFDNYKCLENAAINYNLDVFKWYYDNKFYIDDKTLQKIFLIFCEEVYQDGINFLFEKYEFCNYDLHGGLCKIIKSGNLDFLCNYWSKYGYGISGDKNEFFIEACRYNQVKMIDWYLRNFSSFNYIMVDKNLFDTICNNNSHRVLKWCHENVPHQVPKYRHYYNACLNNHIETLKVLLFDYQDVLSNTQKSKLFTDACQYSNLDIIMMMSDVPCIDPRYKNCRAFKNVCKHGTPEEIKYLIHKFPYYDTLDNKHKIIIGCLKYNNIKNAEYLFTKYNVVEQIKNYINGNFYDSYDYHLSVFEWLHSKYGKFINDHNKFMKHIIEVDNSDIFNWYINNYTNGITFNEINMICKEANDYDYYSRLYQHILNNYDVNKIFEEVFKQNRYEIMLDNVSLENQRLYFANLFMETILPCFICIAFAYITYMI